MKILFVGGPWDGQTKERSKMPKVIGCKTDADKAGMHGVYQSDRYIGFMKWKDVVPKGTIQ